MTTIHTILADPRYRVFAAEVTECGRQVVPDAFPWDCLGLSNLQIRQRHHIQQYIHRADAAAPPYEEWITQIIDVVRAQERLVCEHWDWWLGQQSPEPGSREAAVAECNPCRPGAQGERF